MLTKIEATGQIITNGKKDAIGLITFVDEKCQVGTVTLPCKKEKTVTATVYHNQFLQGGELE